MKSDSSTAPHRALVTGASGFLGGHLARRLLREKWDVHCVLRSQSKLGLLKGWENNVSIHVHDGTTESLCSIVRSAKPEVVFHLASLFIAEHRMMDVTALLDSNVRFSAQLAEAMIAARATRLVNTGSAWEHFRGEEPTNLYAATKRAAAQILRYYTAASPLRVVTLKLFDTFGPEDPRPKLIPALAAAAKSGRRIAMSPGRQKMDLLHVDDVTEAYLVAANRLLRARKSTPPRYEEFMISSGRHYTLREIVRELARATGREIQVDWGATSYRARQIMSPWRAGRTLPGWKPRVTSAEGFTCFEK